MRMLNVQTEKPRIDTQCDDDHHDDDDSFKSRHM